MKKELFKFFTENPFSHNNIEDNYFPLDSGLRPRKGDTITPISVSPTENLNIDNLEDKYNSQGCLMSENGNLKEYAKNNSQTIDYSDVYCKRTSTVAENNPIKNEICKYISIQNNEKVENIGTDIKNNKDNKNITKNKSNGDMKFGVKKLNKDFEKMKSLLCKLPKTPEKIFLNNNLNSNTCNKLTESTKTTTISRENTNKNIKDIKKINQNKKKQIVKNINLKKNNDFNEQIKLTFPYRNNTFGKENKLNLNNFPNHHDKIKVININHNKNPKAINFSKEKILKIGEISNKLSCDKLASLTNSCWKTGGPFKSLLTPFNRKNSINPKTNSNNESKIKINEISLYSNPNPNPKDFKLNKSNLLMTGKNRMNKSKQKFS